MKHKIDPKIDRVFKAILTSADNNNVLLNFLNAMLMGDLDTPIVAVEIVNAFNEPDRMDGKLSIVDVKAKDAEGQLFQIEIQIVHYHYLVARMLHNWAHIFSHQLLEGAEYSTLKPTYAIWLVCKSVFIEDTDYAHTIRFRDDQGRIPMKHGGIWIFELQKFHAQQIANEQQRWLRFFKEGDQLDDSALPDWMSTAIMRQVMSTLRHFSESEKEYFAYQDRVNYVREQLTIQQELDTNQKEIERNRIELENNQRELKELRQGRLDAEQRELQAKQEALTAKAELERLKALLAQQTDKP